jgi:hypothetical protein
MAQATSKLVALSQHKFDKSKLIKGVIKKIVFKTTQELLEKSGCHDETCKHERQGALCSIYIDGKLFGLVLLERDVVFFKQRKGESVFYMRHYVMSVISTVTHRD